jgi:hypothetical protein
MTLTSGEARMADGQGLTYSVDLVLVIDATGSMAPIIESVKSSAVSFHADLQKHMREIGKTVDSLRVRVVVFRDYYADSAADSLIASEFFELPSQQHAFTKFLSQIKAMGGGDEPETALEALVVAIRSPWTTEGAKQRQIIVLWTDASAHPLEKNAGSKPAGYPDDMPADINALTDLWDGQSSPMNYSFKRLLVYSPDVTPWTEIANNWENTLHYTSKAGAGLGDRDYKSILDAIAQSV